MIIVCGILGIIIGIIIGLSVDMIIVYIKNKPYIMDNHINNLKEVININMVKQAISNTQYFNNMTKTEMIFNVADRLYEIVSDHIIINDLVLDNKYSFIATMDKKDVVEILISIINDNYEYTKIINKRYEDIELTNNLKYKIHESNKINYNKNNDMINIMNNFYND